jgi:integrase
VKPVPQDRLDAALPHMPPTVGAMVRLQLLTACRPEELCLLRPVDIDMRDPACWVYRPLKHKTEHHDHDRLIFLGPKAQEVLRPYLGTRVDAYCFSPADSERRRHAKLREGRRTPLTPSQRARKGKARRRRAPSDRYDSASYRRAIARACDRAFPPPEPLARRKDETKTAWLARLTPEQWQESKAWERDHRWLPNQLRHNRATELRRHGLDIAKTVLGHSKIETTQIYAEKDVQAAMELVSRIG